MKTSLHGASIALLLAASPLFAQSFDFVGNTTAINADMGRAPMADVNGTLYYPYAGISSGTGNAVTISTFSSLSSTTGAPTSVAFNFSNLGLTSYSPGSSSGHSIQVYTPGSGATFNFTHMGQTMATAEVVSFVIDTNYSTGVATGWGQVHLTSAVNDPTGFFTQVDFLSGGSRLLDFSVNSFVDVTSDLNSASFSTMGTFTVETPVPEPAITALLAGAIVLAGAVIYRRRAVRTTR